MRSRVAVIALCGLCLVSGRAWGQADPYQRRPFRHGFTLELGIGLSLMHLLPGRGSRYTKVGLAPLSLSLGGFITNELAVMARISGGSWFQVNAANRIQGWSMGFYGVHVQYWFTDWFCLSGGPGFTLYGTVIGRLPTDPSARAGGGFSLRSGFAVANWKQHSLRLSIEIFGSFYKGLSVLTETLIVEWQWF